MRRKIFIVVSLFLLVLFAVGIGSIYLINDTNRKYSRQSSFLFEKSQAIQTLRYDNSSINSSYLPTVQSNPNGFPDTLNFNIYQSSKENISTNLQRIEKELDPNHRDDFKRLQTSTQTYLELYQNLFQERPDDQRERFQAVARIAAASQRINTECETLVSSLEVAFHANQQLLHNRITQASTLIAAILLGSLLVSLVLYSRAKQILLDPLIALTNSVTEIQRGNYELTIPEHHSNDELAALIPAFNKMAAELRTARQTSDEQLLRANSQNSAILSSFPHPILLLNPQGSILKLNPQAESLLSESQTLAAFPPKIQHLVEESVSNDTEYLPERLDEALLIRRNEKEYFYLPRLFRLCTPSGSLEGWVLLLTDVSRLRFFDDLKSNLIATVSHEIKTPLTGIRMILHLLLEKKTGPLNAPQQEMVTSATADCERLLETLRNLLEMSRMDSGADWLQLEPTPAQTLIEKSVKTFHPLASEKSITFQANFSAPDLLVMADNLRIGEVLNNLLSNALKHSANDSTITITAAPYGDDFIRISVADEGSGVPEESRPHIFERFYRAPGQSHIDGIGLGLSISREIIIAHDGKIGISDTQESKTEFYFDLPRA